MLKKSLYNVSMITIEAMTFIVRVGKDNHKFGDPYTGVCSATKVDYDTIRLTAFSVDPMQPFTLQQSIMLAKKFKELGFKYAVWERVRDGQVHYVKRKL